MLLLVRLVLFRKVQKMRDSGCTTNLFTSLEFVVVIAFPIIIIK